MTRQLRNGTTAVDVGTGSGAAFQCVFTNVAFDGIAMHVPLVDGYVQPAPFTNSLTARLAGGSSDAISGAGVPVELACADLINTA